jgi:hypothetical protein
VAVINHPDLRQIALKIVSAPGFGTDQQAMRRALQQWFAAVKPEQRLAAEQAFVIRWLEDVHAEYLRERDREMRMVPAIGKPAVVGKEDNAPSVEEPEFEAPAPTSVLRFVSESPDWRKPAAEQLAAAKRDAPRPFGPVTITNVPDRATVPTFIAPEPAVKQGHAIPPQPAVVQQPSQKIARFQRMFPELAHTVQVANGSKQRGEFDGDDIDYRVTQITKQGQSWQTANAGDEARIEGRERLNAKDRIQVAERKRQIRDIEAEKDRLTAAKAAMAEHGCTTIGELDADVLIACGFSRRAA